MNDLLYVALTLLLAAAPVGLVALCQGLMEDKA